MVRRKKHRSPIVGPRLYERKPDPIKPRRKLDYDREKAERIFQDSLKISAITTASPIGKCLECGKPLPGERKICGRCAVKHEENRFNK